MERNQFDSCEYNLHRSYRYGVIQFHEWEYGS